MFLKKSGNAAHGFTVAAVQLQIELGNVKRNLAKALDLIDQAACKGAGVVVLPEFFTSGIAINPVIDEVPRLNAEFRVADRIAEKAEKLGLFIAGSFLRSVGRDVFNSMVLTEPTGKIHVHDKDIPTQLENMYYAPGDNERSFGRFGLALCWEMLRSKTLQELDGRVELVLSGSCWWSLPRNAPDAELDKYNCELNERTPTLFARVAGLPIVHAALVGTVSGERNLTDRTIVTRDLIGTTQIVDRTGKVIAKLERKDADGVLVETIETGRGPRDPVDPEKFWLVELRSEYLRAWERENRLGGEIYLRRRESGSYPGTGRG